MANHTRLRDASIITANIYSECTTNSIHAVTYSFIRQNSMHLQIQVLAGVEGFPTREAKLHVACFTPHYIFACARGRRISFLLLGRQNLPVRPAVQLANLTRLSIWLNWRVRKGIVETHLQRAVLSKSLRSTFHATRCRRLCQFGRRLSTEAPLMHRIQVG